MTGRPRDAAERLLATTTAGLPARRAEWGAAMRAELASIEDPDARRLFARSAARAAFSQGLGIRIGIGLSAGVLVATISLTASRLQLTDGGPGLLGLTVPVPALVLLIATLVSAVLARSFRVGLETGFIALTASFAAVFTVLAIEGIAWMDRRGVFLLDGDPPRGVVETSDVIFNFFSTGMWLGHALIWVPSVLVGAVLGAWIGGWLNPKPVDSSLVRHRDP